MFDDFPPHEIFTGFEYDFKAVRVLEGELFPVTFRLRMEIAPLGDLPDPEELGNTFTKISYLVDHVLENSILIDKSDEWSAITFIDDETGLPRGVNNLIHFPEPPTNVAFAKLLLCKLNALATENITIGYLNIKSTDAVGMAITSIGDPTDELPDMNDWIGEHSYFSKPWWLRDDASTMDIVPDDAANLAEPPEFAYTLAFLLTPPEHSDDAPVRIVRAEFRPRVIKGGKED